VSIKGTPWLAGSGNLETVKEREHGRIKHGQESGDERVTHKAALLAQGGITPPVAAIRNVPG
jgi:hypothetical protein